MRSTLELVEDVRRFAVERLHLDAGTSYDRYFDTGGGPVAWNVSACPPDRFEAYRWWFPFVGRLPYKGFFDRRRAWAERDRLAAAGYDAIARPVSAYSTLGYLDDPVLSTMADYPEERVAELILHELTHATVYVEDRTDYNESVASFVGQAGSLAFLADRHGQGSEQVRSAQRRRQESARFSSFVGDLVARLDSLYETGLPRARILARRGPLFARAQNEYRRRRREFGRGRFDGFLAWEVNNARLLSYRRYHTQIERFQGVLDRLGGDLAAAVRVFEACGRRDDPWACLEEEEEE